MKKIDAIIYSLPIEYIDTVYLVGESTDYYKLYLEQKNNCIIKIDLKSDLEDNFIRFNVGESVYKGDLTQELSANKALKLLDSCNWEAGFKPDLKTLEVTMELLKTVNFKPHKKEIDKNLQIGLGHY